jgi:hypothetical protein
LEDTFRRRLGIGCRSTPRIERTCCRQRLPKLQGLSDLPPRRDRGWHIENEGKSTSLLASDRQGTGPKQRSPAAPWGEPGANVGEDNARYALLLFAGPAELFFPNVDRSS